MAEKLSITIALEGGKAIEQQLEGIGAAGKKAFDDISKAAEAAGGFKNLKPEEVTAKLDAMGVTGKDALDKITTAVKSATSLERLVGIVTNVEKGFDGLVSAAASFGRALGPLGSAAAAVGIALYENMNKTAEALRKVDSAAIKAGLSIEKFDTLRAGFERMGAAADSISGGIGNVVKEIEKINLQKIKQAAKELEDIQKRGFGIQGTEQLAFLEEQLGKTGKSAAAAREALEKLGVTVITPAATDALTRLGIAATNASEVIPQFVEKMRLLPDSAQRTADAIAIFGDKLGIEFIQILRNGGVGLDAFVSKLQVMTQEQANAANASEQATNRMSAAFERFKQTGDIAFLGEIWTAFSTKFSADVVASIAQLDNFIGKIGELASAVGGGIWDTFASAGTAAINAISGALDALWQKLKDIGSALAGAFGGGGGGGPEAGSIPGNARGGLLGGRGSGTSDSNLAWVSRGEHIMPAAAVRQPGVLALLEALRRSGGNLRGVLDGMGRFAMGGPVSMPALASSGIGGMSNVTIQFPGLPDVGGLRAPANVVEQLRKAAAMAQVRSGGRKPSRYT